MEAIIINLNRNVISAGNPKRHTDKHKKTSTCTYSRLYKPSFDPSRNLAHFLSCSQSQKRMGRAGKNSERNSSYERRAWTRKEDDAIIRLVEEYGTKRWSVISDHLNSLNYGTDRTGKQCRTR